LFAPLVNGLHADIDRQIDWAKVEVHRQTRYTVMIGVLAAIAALAALGAIIVGLIALYFWLTPQTGPFTALGAIGGGLLLLALMLFVPVFVWRRPQDCFAAEATNHPPYGPCLERRGQVATIKCVLAAIRG
jgi:hypothetical protein